MLVRHVSPPDPNEVHAHGWSLGRLALPETGVWDEFVKLWEDLPADPYVRASHRTSRFRRLGRLRALAGGARAEIVPPGSFLQSTTVNSVYGGQARIFAPIPPEAYANDYFRAALGCDLAVVREIAGSDDDWLVTVHLIRIVADGGASSAPAPEGRHSDGHQCIVMHLIGRHNCAGGESRVYRNGEDRPVFQHTLNLPMQTLVIDDRVMEHEVSPIRPVDRTIAVRDMMIIDFDRTEPDVAGAHPSINLTG